jgi:hypothetical protein
MANNQILRTYQIEDANNIPIEGLINNVAANTVTLQGEIGTINISANGASTLVAQTKINFINTISAQAAVTSGGTTAANVAINTVVKLIVPLSDFVTIIGAGSNVAYVHSPRPFTVTGARASLLQAGNSGAVTGQTNVQITINNNNLFVNNAVLLTIDNAALTSVGSVVTPVLTNTSISDDATIKYSINNAGGNAIGLIVTLYGI